MRKYVTVKRLLGGGGDTGMTTPVSSKRSKLITTMDGRTLVGRQQGSGSGE